MGIILTAAIIPTLTIPDLITGQFITVARDIIAGIASIIPGLTTATGGIEETRRY